MLSPGCLIKGALENILIVVCFYDLKNNKSHIFFSILFRIVLFLPFYQRVFFFFFVNIYNIILLVSFYIQNYTHLKNKCFNPRKQNHRVLTLRILCLRTNAGYARLGVYSR